MAREEAADSPEPQGTRLVLVMTAICMTVVAYNTTAVVTILPNLKSGFDLTTTELQWVMAVYTVSAATLVPILGRLGDLIGKMRVFFFGIACFFAGSLAVVLAPDGAILLAGRAAQGAGAAALFGTSLSVLTAATPEAQRASVTGMWGAMIGLGMSLGPIVGGAFAEYLRLPARNLHPVPDSVATDAAVFAEPLAAALDIVERYPPKPGERVLVVGAGRLGQLVCRVLAESGLSRRRRRRCRRWTGSRPGHPASWRRR